MVCRDILVFSYVYYTHYVELQRTGIYWISMLCEHGRQLIETNYTEPLSSTLSDIDCLFLQSFRQWRCGEVTEVCEDYSFQQAVELLINLDGQEEDADIEERFESGSQVITQRIVRTTELSEMNVLTRRTWKVCENIESENGIGELDKAGENAFKVWIVPYIGAWYVAYSSSLDSDKQQRCFRYNNGEFLPCEFEEMQNYYEALANPYVESRCPIEANKTGLQLVLGIEVESENPDYGFTTLPFTSKHIQELEPFMPKTKDELVQTFSKTELQELIKKVFGVDFSTGQGQDLYRFLVLAHELVDFGELCILSEVEDLDRWFLLNKQDLPTRMSVLFEKVVEIVDDRLYDEHLLKW